MDQRRILSLGNDIRKQLMITLKNVSNAIIITNAECIIEYMNPKAFELVHELSNDPEKDGIFDYFNLVTKDKGEVLQLFRGKDIYHELILLSRESNLFYRSVFDHKTYSVMIEPLYLEDESHHLVFTFISDNFPVDINPEMIQIQKFESLSLLAGGIAHDFNNILTGILGNLSLLQMDTDPEDPKYTILESAENAAIQASELTKQLLIFAKGEEPIKKPQSIIEIILEASNFAITGSFSQVIFEIEPIIWKVNINRGQINQVIQNLVINARQAMNDRGKIIIKGKNILMGRNNVHQLEPGPYIMLDFIDEGCGISQENLTKIFDLYFTTKPQGSGIGLSISQSILKKHDGIMCVDSIEGKGTTFTIYLPAYVEVEEELISEKTKSTQIKEEYHILVMEDEQSIARVTQAMLKRLKCKSDIVRDGKEAIRKYTESLIYKRSDHHLGYDAVILDLTIPGGMGAEETILELRKIDKNVKAIITTGYTTAKILDNYKDFGFYSILIKPYTIHDLHTSLNTLFGQ